MFEPTLVTWTLVVFGVALLFPLIVYVQIQVLIAPEGRKAQELWLGKGQTWRDRTHVEFAYGTGWADLITWIPLGIAGSVGVLLAQPWGYGMWLASGAIAVYINVILWFSERKYILPARGALAYYTYEWGAWVIWGLAVVIYSALRLAGWDF